MCGPNSPSGEGASLVVRHKNAGVRARGSEPPLPPAASPCARAGLRAHGPSPRGARGADAASDRVALCGASCAGWVPRVARGDAGRAGLSVTGGSSAVLVDSAAETTNVTDDCTCYLLSCSAPTQQTRHPPGLGAAPDRRRAHPRVAIARLCYDKGHRRTNRNASDLLSARRRCDIILYLSALR